MTRVFNKPFKPVHNCIVDAGKLYKSLMCNTCGQATRHIYCKSVSRPGRCYACMECAREVLHESKKDDEKDEA